jgi:hypothetical protein
LEGVFSEKISGKVRRIGGLKGVMKKRTDVFRAYALIGLLIIAGEAAGQTYDFQAQIGLSGNYTGRVTNSLGSVLRDPVRLEVAGVFGLNLTLRSEIFAGEFFSFRAVAADGDHAYVASNFRNEDGEISAVLQVLDIADVNQPILVGSLRSSDAIGSRLKLAGNRLYCAYFGELRIIDVSDPKSPKMASYSLDLGTIRNMTPNGNYLYVTADNMLSVLDVSNPAGPVLLSQLEFTSTINDLEISGSNVILSDGSALKVIDVSEPREPREVAEYVRDDGAGPFVGLAIAGNFAFLVTRYDTYDWRIDVVDISDPAHPAAVTSLPYSGASQIGKMEVVGRRLFIRRHESQMPGEVDFLGAIDIKDPRHPIFLGELDTAQRQLAPFSDMAVTEDAVILVGGSVRIYQPHFIPMLSIMDANTNVELSWADVDSGFKVQTRSAADMTSVWSDAQATADLVDGQNYVRLPKDSEAKFFRLVKP